MFGQITFEIIFLWNLHEPVVGTGVKGIPDELDYYITPPHLCKHRNEAGKLSHVNLLLIRG